MRASRPTALPKCRVEDCSLIHPSQPPDVGFLLDAEPGLDLLVPEPERADARRAARGRLIRLRRGRCAPPRLETRQPILGFWIAEGLLCRETTLQDRRLIEFHGPGDILGPAPTDESPATMGEPALTALEDVSLIALGSTFIRAGARWPELIDAVTRRMEGQRRRLTAQALIIHLPQAKHRLLLMLWHLSQRWGHVTPSGLHLPLRLTHDILGQLIAARRPTVSLAVKELDGEDLVRRCRDGSWLLTTRGQAAARSLIASDAGRRSKRDAGRPGSTGRVQDSRAVADARVQRPVAATG